MLPALFRLLSVLPLRWLQAIGALFGLLIYAISGSYRRKLQRNLAQAGYPASMRLAAARAAGAMVGELPWVWFGRRDRVAASVQCADAPLLAQARARGRGVLLLTPHLGCFEAAARWHAAQAPITVLFRPARRASVSELLRAARSGDAMSAAPATLAGVRMLLRTLRQGGTVALLPDQVPGVGEGRWAPFFGQPAYTMSLPLRLAQATGAAVVLALGERLPAGRGFALRLERFEGEPTPEAVNAAMERLIRRRPEQYLWGYNRYKRPAGAEPAPQATHR